MVVMTGMASVISLLLHSVLLATDLRTPGGAIPARTDCQTFVGRRHPVMHLQLSLREASTFFAWDDLSHTGQAYFYSIMNGNPVINMNSNPWMVL